MRKAAALILLFGIFSTSVSANYIQDTKSCGGAPYYTMFYNATNRTSPPGGETSQTTLVLNLSTACSNEKYFQIISSQRTTNGTTLQPTSLLYSSNAGGSNVISISHILRYGSAVNRLSTGAGLHTGQTAYIYRISTTTAATTKVNETNRRIIVFQVRNDTGENYSFTGSTVGSNQNNVFSDVPASDRRTVFFTPATSGPVLIWGVSRMNSDSTTVDATVRLQVNGTTVGSVKNNSVGQIIRRDVSTSETGTTNNILAIVDSPASTQNATLEVAGISGTTTDWGDVTISALPLAGFNSYFYNYSTTQVSTTSTSTVSLARLSIPANDSYINRTYVIVGWVNWQLSSTTPSHLSDLRVNDIVNSSNQENIPNIADVLSTTHATMLTLNASQNYTVSLNWSLSSAGTMYANNYLLLALEVNNTPVPPAPPVNNATGTKTIFNDTFTTDTGWSGCSYNSSTGSYDATGNYWTCTSPDYDLANFTWVEWCFDLVLNSAGFNQKFYCGETTSSTSNPHVMIDSSYVTKPEPGYSPSYSGSYGNHRLCIAMNETNDNLTFSYDGTYRWSYNSTAFDWTSGEDYLRWSSGDLNGGGILKMDNSTVTVLCNELAIGACDEAPADSCTYTSGAWAIACSDNCNLQTNTALDGGALTFSGTGTATIRANITGWSSAKVTQGSACRVSVLSGGGIRK